MKALQFIILFMLFPLGLLAEVEPTSEVVDPTKFISSTINNAREYVVKNRDKVSDKKLQERLKEIILPAFDFREMARRSLGKNWKKSTEDEQKEFVDLFSQLISTTYQNRVVSHVADSEINFLDQRIEGKKAMVKSEISVDGDKVDVVYRLKNNGEAWRVYDIIIANVSLVSNYRSEFSGIVRKEKMSGLIAKLKKKKEDNSKS